MNDIIKPPPETPQAPKSGHAPNSNQNPKWWKPRWWTVIGSVLFVIYVIVLFIACRFYVGHPNDTPAFVAGVIGMLTLYAIIAQAVIYWRQAEMMRESLGKTQAVLDQNERHFQLSERPILVVERIKAKVQPNRTISPIFVRIGNKGRSPAVKINLQFCIVRPPERTQFDGHGATLMESPMMVAQGSDDFIVENEREMGSKPLTEAEFDSIIHGGGKSVYVYGQGTYEDFSGNKYVLDKWAFRYTKAYDWVNDYSFVKFAEALKRVIGKTEITAGNAENAEQEQTGGEKPN